MFYRTKSQTAPAYYSGVATTIAVVESVIADIEDEASFIALCRKRSVFTDEELREQWNYDKYNRPFITNFLFVYSLPKRPKLEWLNKNGVIPDTKDMPRGFIKIRNEDFTKYCKILLFEMKALLSIKPEYAYKIFDGSKKYEFRKVIFKNPNIQTVVVYASSPVQQVIGEFDIDIILSQEPDKIWIKTKEFSGITEEFFFEYFADRNVAHAIKIKEVRRYKNPLSIRKDFNVTPPQSYVYL